MIVKEVYGWKIQTKVFTHVGVCCNSDDWWTLAILRFWIFISSELMSSMLSFFCWFGAIYISLCLMLVWFLLSACTGTLIMFIIPDTDYCLDHFTSITQHIRWIEISGRDVALDVAWWYQNKKGNSSFTTRSIQSYEVVLTISRMKTAIVLLYIFYCVKTIIGFFS